MGSVHKTKKRNIPKSVNEMSKEMLQETLQKKKECNARALETVEKLCEAEVDEEWFLDNLRYINQTHYDDATVERSILKLCGYPLCPKKLEKVPIKQYHISTRYNKVFDITERKNFCSSLCYKASIFVKNQLFTSPLWFRDQEVIPKYTILKSTKSSLGEEVVFLPDKIKLDAEDLKVKEVKPRKKENNDNTKKDIEVKDVKEEDSCDVDNKNSVSELEGKCSNLKISDTDVVKERNNANKKVRFSDYVDEKEIDNYVILRDTKTILEEDESEVLLEDNKENNSIISSEIVERNVSNIECNTEDDDKRNKEDKETRSSEDDTLKKSPTKSKLEKSKRKSEPVSFISKVEDSLFEWFSIDTMLYLYGEEKVKEILSDNAEELKQALNLKPLNTVNTEKIDHMIRMFGLLDTDVFNKDAVKTNLKPLPDYSALKEEGKSLEIKVRAFYQGQLEVKQPQIAEEEKKEESEPENVYLPLIDSHAQTSLRRKIVLDKLNRILGELIRFFSTEYMIQMTEVRNLVATFTLTAHNITFRPREWYLVGIVLIKLLSMRDRHLDLTLKLESSQSQMVSFLMNYNLQSNYLDDLISRLTHSSNLIKKLS